MSPAFALYDAGDFDAARQACQALSDSARDPRLRIDAEALTALCLLRGGTREARLDGRGILARLSAQEPSLLERPDVLLAAGIAHTAMDETSDALQVLSDASRRFEAQQRPARLLEVYVALAETWAKFSEWERAPHHLGLPIPQSAADARRIRRAQIESLVQRAARLGEAPSAERRVELVLARWLSSQPDFGAEGNALLERLAQAAPVDEAAITALMLLAEADEREGRWAEAVERYERVVRLTQPAGGGARLLEAARAQAAAALSAIRAPAIALQTREVIAPGVSHDVRLRVRNITRLTVELRRLDLPTWLEQRRGVFAEAALPESGSLVFSADIDTTAGRPLDWWEGAAGTPFMPEPGAYVLVSAGQGADGKPIRAKQLILASDWRAVALTGRDRALLWVFPAHAGEPERADAQAQRDAPQAGSVLFWMAGSFVPSRPTITAGVACFDLPPERNTFRDRRWVALIRVGEHLALVRGELPPKRQAREERMRVILAGPGGQIAAGRPLRVAGMLYESQPAPEAYAGELTVELADHDGRALAAVKVKPSAAGTFAADIPIADDLAGLTCGVVVRQGAQVIENVRGRHVVQVMDRGFEAARGEAGVRLQVRSPHMLSGSQPTPVSVSAAYPWGPGLAGGRAALVYRAIGFPEGGPYSHLRVPAAHVRQKLDGAGRTRMMPPLRSVDFPAGLALYGLWTTPTGWDGRPGPTVQALVRRDEHNAWLLPDSKPYAGVALRFDVGVVQGGATGILHGAQVDVMRAGAPVVSLPVTLDLDGWRSAPWTPREPGEYDVRLIQGGRTVTQRGITVSEWQGQAADHRWSDAIARRAAGPSETAIELEVFGAYRGPLLVALLAGEPVTGHARELTTSPQADQLAVERTPRHPQLVFARPTATGAHFWLGPAIEREAASETMIDIDISARPALPGQMLPVVVTCRGADGLPGSARVILRLTALPPDFGISWLGGAPRLPAAPFAPEIRAATSWKEAPSRDACPREAPVPRDLVAALLAGSTIAVEETAASDGRASFQLRLPNEHGQYLLSAVAVFDSGDFSTVTNVLDVRQGVSVMADAPAEWHVGDRTLLAGSLYSEHAVTARVRFDGAHGLTAEGVEVYGRAAEVTASENGWFEVNLPAGQCVSLTAVAEAVRPVEQDAARLTVVTPAGTQVFEMPYRVHASPPRTPGRGLEGSGRDAPQAAVRVRRVMSVLREPNPDERDPAEPGGGRLPGPDWVQTPVTDSTRLVPGDLLLVREEVEVPATLHDVRWLQSAPAHARFSLADLKNAPAIGRSGRTRADELEWRSGELPTGRWGNEYVLTLLRPGSCVLPAPKVVAGSDSRSVAIDADPTVLVVEAR